MSNTFPRFLATALLVTALPFAAHAQEKDSKGGTPTDAAFVANASAGGIAEVEMGKLAQTNSQSAKVRKFGQQMVADHTKAGEELKSLAGGDRGYATAESAAPDAQKDINALERLKGPEFDREYAKVMVAAHEKTVAIFQAETEKGTSDELKAFAKDTLPTIKHHLTMARDLASETPAPRTKGGK